MKAKILVVDDEQDMVDLLAFNLRKHGFEVAVALDGLDALKRARSFAPELVILDVMMAGIDGFTVCEILRSQPSTAGTAVIFVTACGGQIARMNGRASGGDDYINKPFSPKELIHRVEQVLEARRNRLAADSANEGWERPLPPSALC
jgi:DNA-binding response OmpR family regulator